MIKNVFPRGNTAYGFYSFYDYVIEPDATRIFILKGGPGVGKSTFMKKIGEELTSRGFNLEYHHCSSDNDSIDGLVVPAVRVAIIDGTSPHIVDPKNPGAVDEIVPLGDFWDEKGLIDKKNDIIATNKEIGRMFNKAYSYLSALNNVVNDFVNINDGLMDFRKVDRIAAELTGRITGQLDRQGQARHLFASAFTPNGVVDYLESVVGTMNDIFVIEGERGTGRSTLLKRIADCALMRGYYIEVYHDHLDPKRYAHLIIPDMDIAFTTSEKFENRASAVYDLDECMEKGRYGEKAEDEIIMDILGKKAVKYIFEAKKNHDRMENLYIPNMDFDKINEIREKTLNRILKYAGV